ncbi:MAG: hypothetical protein P4L36_01725 [Holophaga sp.]|nr:hypothetical protein [Holophaga sp.]
MRFQIAQKAEWAQGWMSFIALTLCLAAFCAHAPVHTGHPSEPARMAQSGARPWKIRQPEPPAHAQRIAQAQATDDETGGSEHSRADLALPRPAPALAPGKPGRAEAYQDAGPAFPTGCTVHGSRPRPPPSLA